jgi:hypothetical protein
MRTGPRETSLTPMICPFERRKSPSFVIELECYARSRRFHIVISDISAASSLPLFEQIPHFPTSHYFKHKEMPLEANGVQKLYYINRLIIIVTTFTRPQQ